MEGGNMRTELTFSVVFSILFVVNTAGNTLVILLVIKYRAMKTPMNYLLLNLAVADIIVGVFFFPEFYFTGKMFAHPEGTLGDVLCKTLTGRNVSWIASLVSGFTLVSVSLERYYAILRPTRPMITLRKVKQIVPVCWILATLYTIPSLISKTHKAEGNFCREVYAEFWQYVTYWFLWVFGAGIAPVSIMAVLYAKIIRSLWMQNSSDATQRAVINARKTVTKKSITVSVFYAVCVFPTHVFCFVSIFYPNAFGDEFFKVSYCFVVLNSSVNPFVYTFQCKKFRGHLKRLFISSAIIYPRENAAR